MHENTKQLKGSKSRDEFKRRHKDLDKRFYACDMDFMFVAKQPFPDIIAVIDYKKDTDDAITFAEVIAYNALNRRGLAVYVVTGDAEIGSFLIYRYDGGHHAKPRKKLTHIETCKSWSEFADWEQRLRDRHYDRYREN